MKAGPRGGRESRPGAERPYQFNQSKYYSMGVASMLNKNQVYNLMAEALHLFSNEIVNVNHNMGTEGAYLAIGEYLAYRKIFKSFEHDKRDIENFAYCEKGFNNCFTQLKDYEKMTKFKKAN
jgi:hypothetical protein